MPILLMIILCDIASLSLFTLIKKYNIPENFIITFGIILAASITVFTLFIDHDKES